MTDRELLELAAKAAGIPIVPCTCSDPKWPFAHDEARSKKYGHWNPLIDDGDAFRLAVKLRMGIHYETHCHEDEMTDVVEVFYMRDEDGSTTRCVVQELGADADAATRRAISRAAASIGRGMP